MARFHTPTPEELAALRSYAAEHGRRWKAKLSLDWYHARAEGNRGAILHALRNRPDFCHSGLTAFRFPKPEA